MTTKKELKKEDKRKGNRYPTMNCNKVVNCPCYKGDGYTYRFDAIEFNFCDVCNKKLLNQMIDQFRLEQELLNSLGDGK